MLIDHEMRMQMVSVLVQGSNVAPDIPILTGPEHSLPPFPGDDFGALGVHGQGSVRVVDELTGEEYVWGERSWVQLWPGKPAHIFHVVAE